MAAKKTTSKSKKISREKVIEAYMTTILDTETTPKVFISSVKKTISPKTNFIVFSGLLMV